MSMMNILAIRDHILVATKSQDEIPSADVNNEKDEIDATGVIYPENDEPDVIITIPSTDEDDGIPNLRSPEIVSQLIDERTKMVQHIDDYMFSIEGELVVCTEGFVGNTFTSLGNIVGHLGNLLATTLFHGWRDFKQGELSEYRNSNLMTLSKIWNDGHNDKNYNELVSRGFKFDIPQGMKGTYPVAIMSLMEYLKDVDMVNRTKTLKGVCENIRSDIRSNGSNFDRYVISQSKLYTNDTSNKKFQATGKIFTDSKDSTRSIQEMYTDLYELKYDVSNVIEMDKYMREVAKVHGTLEDIGNIVRSISSESVNVDAAKMKHVSSFVRIIADNFYQYATCINDLNRINHNLTVSLTNIRKMLKM